MKSKKRVQDTLNHKQPDRIPIDFGGTMCSGMHVTCVAALRDYYELEKRPVKINEPFQLLGLIEDDLKEVIGVDFAAINGRNTLFGFPNENWKEWRLENGLEVLVPEKFNTTIDTEGNTYIYPEGDLSVPPSGKLPKSGYYFDAIIRQEEIDEDNLNPGNNLQEFKPITEEDLDYFKNAAEKEVKTGYALVANFGGTALGDIALVPGPFLKHPKGIRDVAEWYISTAIRQEYVHTVFNKQTDIALDNLKKLNESIGSLVDAAFICGTDFGTQTGTFCSPKTFRDLYMPYYKKVNDWIHANTGWKTFKHCCGAIESFIPLLIEAGFDILNPVQCSASGMEPEKLKNKYGKQIVFWGGGIDTQRVLPFGTPEAVREQVLSRCEIFSQDGGFVFNAIHNVQAKTPVENIVAMIDAVHEFNGN
ncbi:MAG: methyltransferase [Ruminiclostridium sp.]|nr:methyltransferase [Ruminiclostridium sp.]